MNHQSPTHWDETFHLPVDSECDLHLSVLVKDCAFSRNTEGMDCLCLDCNNITTVNTALQSEVWRNSSAGRTSPLKVIQICLATGQDDKVSMIKFLCQHHLGGSNFVKFHCQKIGSIVAITENNSFLGWNTPVFFFFFAAAVTLNTWALEISVSQLMGHDPTDGSKPFKIGL